MTDRVVLGLFFSITCLKLEVFIEDLHGGRVFASWNALEVGLLPSFGSEVTEQIVLGLFFSVTCLELSVLTDGLLGGLELVSWWTAVGVGFPPSFGDQR